MAKEEHSIAGGFGSACLERVARSGVPFEWLPIGAGGTFGGTGSYKELPAAYGPTPEAAAGETASFMR
jgi:transketolase C-terminal domain/subunit